MRIPKMGLLIKNRDIWEAEFGELKIDREKVRKMSNSHRGSVRISSERYYTNEEYEARRQRVLSKPLP